jgi:nucleotide-binding universal stress UspA family protein
MKTILIPTDFTETSKNAAEYAVGLASLLGIPKLVFYHFYQTKLVYTSSGELDEYATIEPNRNKSIEDLNEFVESLGTIPSSVQVEMYHGAVSINVGIAEVAKITSADLIVMGIKGGGIIKESIIGSHTLSIAKHTTIPVLIIPAYAKLNKCEKITFLSDFKDVDNNNCVEGLRTFLDHGIVKLTVLHLLRHSEKVDEAHPEKLKLEKMFKKYNPTFQYKESHHYTDDVIDFVFESKTDILALVPKHHGLLETIFNDHTTKLAFHSKVPLLIVN